MALTSSKFTSAQSVRYLVQGTENTDNGAQTIDIVDILGLEDDGDFTKGGAWPYEHQVAVHTTATSGTFTVTVKAVGNDNAKNIADGIITLTATVADQTPIIFEGWISEIIITPAGMTSESYTLSVAGSNI